MNNIAVAGTGPVSQKWALLKEKNILETVSGDKLQGNGAPDNTTPDNHHIHTVRHSVNLL